MNRDKMKRAKMHFFFHVDFKLHLYPLSTLNYELVI